MVDPELVLWESVANPRADLWVVFLFVAVNWIGTQLFWCCRGKWNKVFPEWIWTLGRVFHTLTHPHQHRGESCSICCCSCAGFGDKVSWLRHCLVWFELAVLQYFISELLYFFLSLKKTKRCICFFVSIYNPYSALFPFFFHTLDCFEQVPIHTTHHIVPRRLTW